MNESPISTEKSHKDVILCANVKAGAAVLLSATALAFVCIFMAYIPHGFSIIAAVTAIGLTAFVVICRPNEETMNPACICAFVAAAAAVFSYPLFSMSRHMAPHPITFMDNLFSGVFATVPAMLMAGAFLGYRKFFMERCRNMD